VRDFLCVAVGAWLGALLCWAYFACCRLLRTKAEWYLDPVIRRRYPRESAPYVRGMAYALRRLAQAQAQGFFPDPHDLPSPAEDAQEIIDNGGLRE